MPHNEQSSSDIWARLIQGCLDRRLRGEKFGEVVKQVSTTTPIDGWELADVLLDQQKLLPREPLLPVYADSLLDSNHISTTDLLHALYKHSRQHPSRKSENNPPDATKTKHVYSPAELEYTILDQLSRAYFPGGTRPKSPEEVRGTLKYLAEWMSAVAEDGDALLQTLQPESILMIDSLGSLGITMLENTKVVGIIDTALPKVLRKLLSQALTAFVPYWIHASPQHAHDAGRLENAQRSRALVDASIDPASHEGTLDVAAELQLQAVADLHITYTRPSIFVFISSLLVGCPLTDDSMMMNYLHVRYKGDIESLAVDLTVAGFDILSCAVDRNEPGQTMFALKSFLINKIPVLLSTLAGSMYPPLTTEYCIDQALRRVDLNTFPSFGMGMLSNSALQEVRQEFIYGCTLHGLLPIESVNRLLEETPFTPPPTQDSRYHKDILSQECATEPGKAVQLIVQLEKLDGNAGAIVGAVTETIRTACATKDTMSLKSICNALSGKPQLLDVMMQFTSPASILQPLCNLLDAWRYEDDQGEYQPVYDEFASIFLLVLAFVYRYQFTHTELGIPKHSFVATYMAVGHKSLLADELDDEQNKYLINWLKGLYDPQGITEEVTGACRPQQFYLIVPTIFSQTMRACAGDALDMDIVKNGLEYLHEPFLLPSLVGAIYWMVAYAKEQRGSDVDILLQMIQRVTRAPSSGDAQSMHATIMFIVGLPLTNCLRTLRKENPQRSDIIEPLIANLKPYIDFRRGPYNPCPELRTWRVSGGLKQTLRANFQSLIAWSSATGINPQQPPPHYNPRLLLIAECVLGAPTTLSALLEELKAQTESPTGTAAVALDIATALICTPKTENSPVAVRWVSSPVQAHSARRTNRLNLREALRLVFDNATDLIQKDQTMAETVVRLYRLVEAQLALPAAPMVDIAPMPTIITDLGMSTDVGVESAHPAQQMDFTQDHSASLDMSNVDAMQLDTGMGDIGMFGGNDDDDDVFGSINLDLDLDYLR